MRYFKDPMRDFAVTALAGPVSNLAQVMVYSLIFHAAMALESLAILDDVLARRRSIALLYRELLGDIPCIGSQAVRREDASARRLRRFIAARSPTP